MLQVSLSQLQASVAEDLQWSEFESCDSQLDLQLELDLLEAVLEELF